MQANNSGAASKSAISMESAVDADMIAVGGATDEPPLAASQWRLNKNKQPPVGRSLLEDNLPFPSDSDCAGSLRKKPVHLHVRDARMTLAGST